LPAPARSDYDLNQDALGERGAALTPAAVLIPIIARQHATTVVFTERAADLRRHAGQISFPGGKIDPEDADDIAAALREAEEEIRLPRAAVEVIGRLGRYETRTGFLISPVVGLLSADNLFVPQASEVASVFEVPLAYLIDPQNIERHSREWQGRQRHYYAIPYEDRYIWGATAGMIVQLARQLGKDVDG
jgi:8-oxo-dGTP pyrophosphatase MutT (NUDIX family)